MTPNTNSLILVSIVLLALITLVTLTRNTNTEINFNLIEKIKFDVKTQSILEKTTKVDCPGEDVSQLSNCDRQ